MMRSRTGLFLLAAGFLAAGTVTVLGQAPALYTAAQATAGASVYQSQCAACHGDNLEGSAAPALKGDGFHAMASAQGMTAASLLSVTAQSMPQAEPGTLTPEQYNDVVAYILQQNGYPAGTDELSPANTHLSELSLSQ